MVDDAPLAAARGELARLRALGATAALASYELLGRDVADAIGWPAAAAAAAAAVPVTAAAATAADAWPPAGAAGEDGDDLVESERAELRRLDATVTELAETNDRIMAQNIALLADLEVAQRAVRELRAEKDALALQLQRALGAGR